MKKWINLLTIGCFFLLAGRSLDAAQAERMVLDSAEDFLEGEGLSVSIDEPGLLTPGPAVSRLADLKDLNVWTTVRDARTGDFILGTGPEGEVFRVKANGKVMRLSAFIESDVYAVTQGPKGEIYVASSPHGKVFRIEGSGKVEEYFNPKEEFIWSLTADKNGDLYVATGPSGKIFKVTAKGKGSVYYDSDEPHIKVLAFDKEGALLAGSSENGYLYRITSKDQAVVLLDSEKEEISAIAVQPDGTIFAAAIGKRSMPVKAVEPPKAEPSKASPPQPSTSFSSESGTAPAAPAPKTPAVARPSIKGESSMLYRLSGNFYPEAIWRGYLPILSLLADGDTVWIGSANDGLLFQYTKDRELRRLGKLEAADVTALVPGGKTGTVFAVTSNMGQIFEVNSTRSKESLYHSKVVDSQLFSRWGKLDIFGQGKWTVRSRSGNTSDPDKSWYPWKYLDDGKVQSPAARYLQFEIALNSGFVDRVELSYLPQNQGPVISSVKILESGTGYELLAQPAQPPQAQTLDQLQRSPAAPNTNPDRLQPVEKKGLRTVVWQASDANKDELLYKLEIRHEGSTGWEVLAKDLGRAFYSWDTTGWEDGTYYLKVTADDSRSNPEGESLSSYKVSGAWKIDNTAPVITLNRRTSDKVVVEVRDATSRLDQVEVSRNARDFKFLLPRDGILDSNLEAFEVSWDGKTPLYFRAEDENGNVGGLRVSP